MPTYPKENFVCVKLSSNSRLQPIEKDDQTEALDRASVSNQTVTFEKLECQLERLQRRLVLAVCAMAKKSNSRPMRSVLTRLKYIYGGLIDIFVFAQDTIVETPVAEWPLCDALLAWYSDGFPLHKAEEYARLRRPFLVNDLQSQYLLQDRPSVYRICESVGVHVPKFKLVVRDKPALSVEEEEHFLVENVDNIVVDGELLQKPFVEKPLDADDHNVIIYFPSSVGGGCQKLFRKIGNTSSEYSKHAVIRRDASYMYEEFIPAEGIDVKVYAVGPFYVHAEARKAPCLDGVVERDEHGKEIRYPVILTPEEKVMATNVVTAFKQTICGFDLLRTTGKSYVCDVNGLSLVKSSAKYYDDCAWVLGNILLRNLAKHLHIPDQLPIYKELDPLPKVETVGGKTLELRCVIGILRHGDRTPKQKLKMVVDDARMMEIFEKEGGNETGELKMKKPKQLQQILELAKTVLEELNSEEQTLLDKLNKAEEWNEREICIEELKKIQNSSKSWECIRTVLETGGHFSGINRKVQLRRKRKSGDGDEEMEPELLLIVKWGGELTKAGVMQAEELGRLFRTLYPAMHGVDSQDQYGLGFLRLHSTFRHDMKLYASDEGRVQMTAAAFTRGLLALEGDLPPIIAQMVKSANTDGLLDHHKDARNFINQVKSFMHDILQQERDLTEADVRSLNPTGKVALNKALEFIGNPRRCCQEIFTHVSSLCQLIARYSETQHDKTLYQSETWMMAATRWKKLLTDFGTAAFNGAHTPDGIMFDISKIPDMYDNLKYDMEHNPDLTLPDKQHFERLYNCVKAMADVLVPLEYGICDRGKLNIAQGIATPLMKKVLGDLYAAVGNEDNNSVRLNPGAAEGISSPARHIRSRLYFTSESHLHSVMNLIIHGGLRGVGSAKPTDLKWQRAMEFLSRVGEYNYMTQIVFMLYEDSTKPLDSPDRFLVSIHFSPGLYPCLYSDRERLYKQLSSKYKPPLPTDIKPYDLSSADIPEETSGECNCEALLPLCSQESRDHDDEVRAKKVERKITISAVSPRTSEVAATRRVASSGAISALAVAKTADPMDEQDDDDGCEDRCRTRKNSITPSEDSNGPPQSRSPKPCSSEPNISVETTVRKHWPYQLKNHALNHLENVNDRFISNCVIGEDLALFRLGSPGGSLPLGSRRPRSICEEGTVILKTAVYGTRKGEPTLFKPSDFEHDKNTELKREIRRFWPPLRSLETLHDQIPFSCFKQFIENVINIKVDACDISQHSFAKKPLNDADPCSFNMY